MRALFTITIFVGSALLFLVQPLIAKQLLPVFGGSPLVWNTSLMFFQAMLLLGYLYAHHSIRLLGARRQAILHCVVMALAALVLPLRIPEALRNAYETALATAPNSFLAEPAPVLLAMLFAGVGLPFFALSAGAPTLQRWFAQTSHRHAADPYFLYQASNLASMVALLGYPAWFERFFPLSRQGIYWSWGYGFLLLLMALCAFRLSANRKAVSEPEVAENPALKSEVTAKDKLMWVFLAACPTALMGGMTTYLTTDLAPIPLLWVLPLALYLITFVIAFAKGFNGRLVKYFAMVALFLVVIFMLRELTRPVYLVIPLHLIAFFLTALACHWEIGRNRPSPRHLTAFYVWISLGGVAGGFFAAIVAPLVFNCLAEYPIALGAAFVAIAFAQGREFKFKWLDLALSAGLAILTYLARASTFDIHLRWLQGMLDGNRDAWMYIAFFGLALCAIRPLRFGILVLGLLCSFMATDWTGLLVYRHRTFFGVLTVQLNADRKTDTLYSVLLNGMIVHGAQAVSGPIRYQPLTYFTRSSGLGRVMEAFGKTPLMDHVACVGLGTGTTAAYGRVGMHLDFYEIDPGVERMARDPGLFTYLADSKATIRVLIGDARLRLREAPQGGYGLIILDAFSSDSIPVHLLTREAMQVYLRALAPHGILAIHISNKYLDLEPVINCDARDLGLVGFEAFTLGSDAQFDYPSDWVLLARRSNELDEFVKPSTDLALSNPPGMRTWTDDYSNVLGALKFNFPGGYWGSAPANPK